MPAPGAALPALTSIGLGDDLLSVLGAITDLAPGDPGSGHFFVLGEQIKPVAGAPARLGRRSDRRPSAGPC